MKITAKEIAAIHALLTCDYATDVSGDPRSPDHAGHYVWAWCVDGAGLGRGAGGVVASLKRKGLVDCSGFGKEAATAVTAAGLAAYLEHGAEDADVAASWAARDARVAARATAAAEAHAEDRDDHATSEPKFVNDAIGFKIVHTNGRTDTILSGGFDGYGDACDAVRIMYRSSEVGHDGGLLDCGDRTLVWACAEDAWGDDGSHAVAKIVAMMPTWFDATCPYCGKCGEHSHDIQDFHYPEVRS